MGEHQHPVFASLDNECFCPEGKDRFRSFDKIGLASELAGFAFIDDENVDTLDDLFQRIRLGGNPEIHGVAGYDPWAPHLV